MEEWKEIEGWPGYYVTKHGRVYNTVFRNGQTCRTLDVPKEIKPHMRDGYESIQLCNFGKQKQISVHRLVLTAFKGECPEGYEGSHIDGNRRNNCVGNLVWESRSENLSRKKYHGTAITYSKLNAKAVIEIRALLESGMKQRAIASSFNVSEQCISDVKLGRRWSHV